ncbi:MAG: DNA-binding protein [Xanthomonadales bacterium]|nr:DNA-binding protein [Xanthomonadales bacterium]
MSFDEVKHAADAQPKAGVRPTIQSLHAALGTGSSTTILKHLNDWWQQLGQRLVSQQAALAIPDAPENVQAAAGTFWHTALEAANALLGERRQELETHYQGQVDALNPQNRAPWRPSRSPMRAPKARINEPTTSQRSSPTRIRGFRSCVGTDDLQRSPKRDGPTAAA